MTMTTDTDSARAPRDPDAIAPLRTDKQATPIAASAATWAFAFLVFRIFAVSGYDWNTACNCSYPFA